MCARRITLLGAHWIPIVSHFHIDHFEIPLTSFSGKFSSWLYINLCYINANLIPV